jgi:hypothetical protein
MVRDGQVVYLVELPAIDRLSRNQVFIAYLLDMTIIIMAGDDLTFLWPAERLAPVPLLNNEPWHGMCRHSCTGILHLLLGAGKAAARNRFKRAAFLLPM